MSEATYSAVMLMRTGGVDSLQIVELPVKEPGRGEARLRIRAVGASGTDLLMRRGLYPGAPWTPYVMGYEAIGDVEAIGPGVTQVSVGQRVAALVEHGAYAERPVCSALRLVPILPNVDDSRALALVVNYVTAWQCLHRLITLKAGQTVLVTGANGGVGTALLELARLAHLRAIGAASARHHELVRSYGALPVESRGEGMEARVRALAPEGVDASIDGLGGSFAGECVRATRRGGTVVAYSFGAVAGRVGLAAGIATLYTTALATGRRAKLYRISTRSRQNPDEFRSDLLSLINLLAQDKLEPRIAARLPLLAAREAAALLEKGGLEGKIVHLRDLPAA